MINYDDKYKNTMITEDNVEILTGINPVDLLKFTGVHGSNILNSIIDCSFSNYYPRITITLKCAEFELTRTLDISTKIIYNQKFTTSPTGFGLGTKVFTAQVEHALNEGFTQIQVRAAGDYSTLETLNGYITWAKLGFTWKEDSSYQDKFNFRINASRRTDKTLQQLLEKKEGPEIWKEIGFPWYGYFDLKWNSKNMQILRMYIRHRTMDKSRL